MALNHCEAAQSADARRMAYSFFADVFSAEVNRDFVAGMSSFEAEEGSKLAEFTASLDGCDLDEATQDVRSEFCALFLNMCAHPVYTSESVYLSDNHVIMQEQRDQIVEVYRMYKLSVDRGSFDWPEDHISMEMLFMAHLCELERDLCLEAEKFGTEAGSEAEAVNARIKAIAKAQQAFFAEHLDRWAPMFIDELSSQAKTLFYQGIAEYLAGFLEGERELLDSVA